MTIGAEHVINRSINWDLLGGEGLSRGKIFGSDRAMGKVPLGEKVGRPSTFVEKIMLTVLHTGVCG